LRARFGRDYPVVFGTLYIFSLMGLVVALLSDLVYMWVDPRIDFEARRTCPWMDAQPRSTSSRTGRERCQGRAKGLSPTQCAPLNNFKANRRGWWSLWIFLACSSLTLFAEFIANERPLIVSYKGEILFRCWSTIRRKSSAASGAVTRYYDPFIREEIEANGWMLWPPIRYSTPPRTPMPRILPYPTANLDAGGERPARPIRKARGPLLRPGNMNWLGTDDQGRDVLARLIYGFRLSVLFGLTLTLSPR
jgi:microcin C transport system permease protein